MEKKKRNKDEKFHKGKRKEILIVFAYREKEKKKRRKKELCQIPIRTVAFLEPIVLRYHDKCCKEREQKERNFQKKLHVFVYCSTLIFFHIYTQL